MAERLVQNITSDYLTCSICVNTFTNPKMLQCTHSFCARCLEHYIESVSKTGRDSFDCPICRRPFPIDKIAGTSDWIKRLSTDTVSISILKAIGVKPDKEPANEDEEKKQDAPSMVEETLVKETFRHGCPDHPDKKLDVYCAHHDVVICSECAWRNHKATECECCLATDVITKRFSAIKCLVMQQRQDAKRLAESTEANVPSVEKCRAEFRKGIQEVEEGFATVCELFANRVEYLKDKADKVISNHKLVQAARDMSRDVKEKLTDYENKLQTENPNDTLKFISQICKTSSDFQLGILELKEGIETSAITKYIDCDLTSIDAFVSSTREAVPEEFVSAEKVLQIESQEEDYVMITDNGLFPDFNIQESDSDFAEESIASYHQYVFSAKLPGETRCMLSSAALLGTAAVVVVDQMNKKVKKFKIPEGRFLDELQPELEPHQVATLKESSNVVVTVWDVPKIMLIRTDPKLEILSIINTDLEYIGVTSHLPEQIAVSSIRAKCVDVLPINEDTQCNVTSLERHTVCQSSRKWSFPDRLAATSDGHVVIRNRHRNEITCFSTKGELLWSRRLHKRAADILCFRGRVFASLREKNAIVSFRENGYGTLQTIKPDIFLNKPWSLSGFKDCLIITEDSPSEWVHVLVFK